MARRLKDQGYPVTAVYDAFPQIAAALAAELGCSAAASLAEVTAAADVIASVPVDRMPVCVLETSGRLGSCSSA